MKNNKPKQLFIFLLFTLTLLILLFPLNAKGISDISFTFNNDVITNIQNPSFNDTFNIRSSSEYTEHYNSTYSFENDDYNTYVNGQESLVVSNIDFADNVVIATNDGFISIQDNNSHSKILNLTNKGGSAIYVKNNFELQIIGTIELWVKGNFGRFYIRDGSSILCHAEFRESTNLFSFFYGNGVGGSTATSITWNHDWIHIRIDFNTISDTWDGWVNNIKLIDDVPFRNDVLSDGVNTVWCVLEGSNTEGLYDAIGYNFDTTYDFESDIIGTFPNNWINFSTEGGNISVIANRTQVVKFETLSLDGSANMYTTFAEIEIGFIEFDISCNFTDLSTFLTTLDFNDTRGVYLIYSNEVFKYHDTENHFNSSIIQYNNNIWYHNEIYFDTNLDTFTWYINDILYYENVNFQNSIPSIDNIKFWRLDTGEWSEILIDNVVIHSGIHTYIIGSNLLPSIEVNEFIKEVDRYEFALKNVNEFYNDGDSNPSGWSDVESGGGFTKIINGLEPSKDREMLFFIPDSAIAGTSKDNLGLTGNFINITFQMTIVFEGGSDGFTSFVIYSSDTTEIATLIFQHDTTLQYWNGSAGIELRNDLVVDKYYEFNIMLNYELDTVFLIYSVNSTIIAFYNYPMITTGKSGLSRIIFTTLSTGDLLSNAVDYIGIYENGISQSNEFGWLSVDLEANSWNFESNNLLFLTSNGNYHLSICVDTYSVGETLHSISNFDDYDNSTKLFNTYDNFISNITNPFMIFTIQNLNFSLNDIKIEGVQLLEGINIHILEFDYSNVDIDNSFFRVIGNQLTFTHISNDTNLEFIQASFNITDISTDGYTTSFRSNIDNNALGFFRLNFTTTSNIIPIPTSISDTRFIPTQNKTIRSIIILITDRDIDSISGITTGFVSNIKFIVSSEVGVSFLITTLIIMIIPLLMILIPSISISQIYGKVLLIPIFLLMSIICVATGIIPVWLFFTIGFSCTMFILKSKEIEGLD